MLFHLLSMASSTRPPFSTASPNSVGHPRSPSSRFVYEARVQIRNPTSKTPNYTKCQLSAPRKSSAGCQQASYSTRQIGSVCTKFTPSSAQSYTAAVQSRRCRSRHTCFADSDAEKTLSLAGKVEQYMHAVHGFP